MGATMAHEIHLARVRDAFLPRREPYWGTTKFGRGCALGFRKISNTEGSWIARKRDESGHKVYRSLGYIGASNDYQAALKSAEAWFTAQAAGVVNQIATVESACKAYVTDRRQEKGESCAHDAEKRFERTVYGTGFGKTPLFKLRTARIKSWRDDLKLSKGSSNRTLTALKAALNLAVVNKLVGADAALEWRAVKAFANATERRTLFLDLQQRRSLLDNATGGIRNLMEAAALTGARAGELINAIRSQFDSRLKVITFKGKTGTRTIPLSAPAVTLFKRLAKNKLPAAFLLTRDDGKQWSHSDWDELVREAATKAKLPQGVCLYTLRHSFVSQTIQDGMTTLDVARLCGTSVGMIEKHYGHLSVSSARQRLAKVQML
jgi:integrase